MSRVVITAILLVITVFAPCCAREGGISDQQLPLASATLYGYLIEKPLTSAADTTEWSGSAFCVARDPDWLTYVTNFHCIGIDYYLEETGRRGHNLRLVKSYGLELELPSGNFVVVDSFFPMYPADIALLRVKASRLSDGSDFLVLPLLPSDILPIPGSIVIAVGAPIGFSCTVTSGVVSAYRLLPLGMDNESLIPCIQTDAAINPGNSGGPLLSEWKGSYYVIGVNTWRFIDTQGINLAIDFRQLLTSYMNRDFPPTYPADADGFVDAMNYIYNMRGVSLPSSNRR